MRRIKYESIKTFSTPRRLTIIVEGLDERQEDIEETVKGPAKRYLDEEENPTKALLGFMRGQGVDISSIYVDDHNGVDYVFVEKDSRKNHRRDSKFKYA